MVAEVGIFVTAGFGIEVEAVVIACALDLLVFAVFRSNAVRVARTPTLVAGRVVRLFLVVIFAGPDAALYPAGSKVERTRVSVDRDVWAIARVIGTKRVMGVDILVALVGMRRRFDFSTGWLWNVSSSSEDEKSMKDESLVIISVPRLGRDTFSSSKALLECSRS